MFGREVGIWISEESFGGRDQFRIIGARAQRLGGIWRRSHGIHIGIVGESWMGVMIEGGDFLNLGKQMLVNLLQIRTRKWMRLRRRSRKGHQHDCEEQ